MKMRRARDWAFWLVPILAILAIAPLMGRYIYFLTMMSQYEFTPVFLGAWLGIVILRRNSYFLTRPRHSRLGLALVLLAILSLTAGVCCFNSWFGYIAFIFAVGATFAFLGNWRNSYPLLPVWAALLILVRPPLRYDRALLIRLRWIASDAASRIADILGVPHHLKGVTFSLSNKQMFMDDACSGIISLLTCMAAAALIAVWRGRGTIHFVLLSTAGAFWAVIFNILRVEVLLCAWHWYSVDLTSGWKHDCLGYFALSVSALCILATDLSLHWVLQATSQSRSVLTEIWNRHIANPQTCDIDLAQEGESLWQQWRSSFQLQKRHIALAIILLGFVIFQMPGELRTWKMLISDGSPLTVDLITPAPFPESYDQWRHVSQPDSTSIWRLDHEIKSLQATYMRDQEVMIVAVAYPYSHWHDVSRCYENSDWQISNRDLPADLLSTKNRNALLDAVVHLEMHRDSFESATVLFAFLDLRGTPIPAPRPAKSFSESIRLRFGFDQEERPDFKGILVQALWLKGRTSFDKVPLRQKLTQFENILNQVSIDWTRRAKAIR